MDWTNGIIVAGYGIASGRGKDCHYPGGSIHMQQPFFKDKGVDLSCYYPGTLNVDLAPYVPKPNGEVFDGLIRWFDGIEERFMLSPIEIEAKGHRYSGLWYYPHPETKVEHFQRESVVELLLPWIDGLAIGKIVGVRPHPA